MFFVCLLLDLLQLLNEFDLFVVVHEFIKVAIVVVDYFHLVGSFVESVNICSELLLEGLHVGALIKEVLNGEGIADRVDNLMILLQLLNGRLVE